MILQALEKNPAHRFPSILLFAQTLQQAMLQLAQEQAAAKTERFDPATAQTLPARHIMPSAQPFHRELAIPITLDPLDTSEERILDEPLPAKPQKVPGAALQNEVSYVPLSLKSIIRRALPARPRIFAWSPDGSYIACSFYEHAPLIVARDGRGQVVQFAQAQEATSICWSPDSRVLAVSARGTIHFWDHALQSLLPLVLYGNVRSIGALDWSADTRLAAWVDNQIVLYPLPYTALTMPQVSSMQTISTGATRCGNVGVLRWSPDASQLVVGASNGLIVGWHGKHLASVWRVAEVGQKVNSIAWSPDGVLLAGAMRDNRVVAWDARSKNVVSTWTRLPAMPRTISISLADRITVASTERRLLSGFPEEAFPSTTLPGQLLASWSPLRSELVALEENQETAFVLWCE